MHRIHSKLFIPIGLFCLAVVASQTSASADARLVDTLVDPYLTIQAALAKDDLAGARSGAKQLVEQLESAETRNAAMASLAVPARKIGEASDIEAARRGLSTLTHQLMGLLEQGSESGKKTLYVVHCPMAFDGEGGTWLQADKSIANPYYGSAMLRCGSVERQLGGSDAHGRHGHSGHDH